MSTSTLLSQECADFATSLRSAFQVAKLQGKTPESFLRAADLLERASAALTQAADAGAAEPVAYCVDNLEGPANMATRFFEFPAPQWQLDSMDAAFPELAPHRNVPLYAAPPAQQLQQAVARAVEKCAAICERAVDSIWEYHEDNHKRTGVNVCTNLAAAIRQQGTP